MGTVYLARDLKLDRPVALKVLPAEFASQVSLRDRFLRETRTAASFSHPNIVPVYAVEETDDLLAYAMGLVEGETLAERVGRMGPLPTREIVRMMQDVGYEVVGSPEYMSPEQASGDVVDGRSDLYSLGLSAHFAATGRTAVTAESTQKILVKQLTEPVPPIAASRPDVPPALAEAIDRCVAKDPVARFATAEALVEAIDAAQLPEPEIPVPVRLFAQEVSTLSLVAIGGVLFSWPFVRSSTLGSADTLLPVVGLFAVLLTRALTTLSEARRLAVAGFAADDVIGGFARVVRNGRSAARNCARIPRQTGGGAPR